MRGVDEHSIHAPEKRIALPRWQLLDQFEPIVSIQQRAKGEFRLEARERQPEAQVNSVTE